MTKPRIVVEVEQGLVNGVSVSGITSPVEVVVLDYDIQDEDEADGELHGNPVGVNVWVEDASEADPALDTLIAEVCHG